MKNIIITNIYLRKITTKKNKNQIVDLKYMFLSICTIPVVYVKYKFIINFCLSFIFKY